MEGSGWKAPSARAAGSTSRSRTPGSEGDSSSPYVLIVEDDENAGSALRVLFEATGYRAAVAASVAEATRAILETAPSPDLVLLDLTLPDGDGFTVLRRVGEMDGAKPVVVVFTGHDDPALADRCRAMGCRDVLVKPVPPRELLRKVREWLAETRDDAPPAA